VKVNGTTRAIRLAPRAAAGKTNLNIWSDKGRFSVKLRIAKSIEPTTIWKAERVDGVGVAPKIVISQKPGKIPVVEVESQKDILVALIEALELVVARFLEQVASIGGGEIPTAPKVEVLSDSPQAVVPSAVQTSTESVASVQSIETTPISNSTESTQSQSTPSTDSTAKRIALRLAKASHATFFVPGSPAALLHNVEIPMGDDTVLTGDYLLELPYIKDPVQRSKMNTFINGLIAGDGLETSLKSSGMTIENVRKLLENYG
jgi:hypothetical protein